MYSHASYTLFEARGSLNNLQFRPDGWLCSCLHFHLPGLAIMVTLVSCFFDRNAHESLVNHAEYCRRAGARHRFEPVAAGAASLELRIVYKYQLLCDLMVRAADNELLIFATENALFLRFNDFESMMVGRDALVTTGHFGINSEIVVLRNTEGNRVIARSMAAKARAYYDYGQFVTEDQLLEALPVQSEADSVNERFPIVSACSTQFPELNASPIVALSLVFTPRLYSKYGPRWGTTLARHVNACHASAQRFFEIAPPEGVSSEALSVYQPGQRIAVVMLYTPNIANYACFGEASLRDYCEQHGYTLYMHREVPADFAREACGNWAKPFLLSKYLPHHDWVFWIDADILATNRTVKLEDFMEGRERVLSADIAGWPFNSGVMGFRNTEVNARVLQGTLDRIRGLDDLSWTFSNHGDQAHFMFELEANGVLPARESTELVSFRELNTPWYYADQNTFLCHFHGIGSELRMLFMSMKGVPEGGFD